MRTYTREERYQIGRVLDKVYEVLTETTNDVKIEIGFLGVTIGAYNGPMDPDDPAQEFAIFDMADEFSAADADRMIAELDVLSHFNRVKADTTKE